MKARKWLILVLSAVMVGAVGLGIGACGGNKTPTHKHTYDAWDYSATEHWKYCDEHGTDKSNIDESTRAEHVYDQAGNKCVCGAEKPAEEYDHKNDTWGTWHDNGNGTCTSTASCDDRTHDKTEPHDYGTGDKCTRCGADKPVEEYDHKNDTWGTWHDNGNGTCTSTASCDDRTHDKTEPHDYGTGDKCTRCGADKPVETTLEAGWYIVGDVANLGLTWTSGKYAEAGFVGDGLTVTLTAADNFKFSKFAGGEDETFKWDDEINYNTFTAKLEGHFMNAGGGNISVKSAKCVGEYTFKIDADGVLTVETEVPEDNDAPDLEEGWYIVGEVSNSTNWDTYVKTRFIPEDEGLTIALKTTDKFKFAKYVTAKDASIDWETPGRVIGYTDAFSSVCKRESETSDNFQVLADDTYLIKITAEGVLSITKQGGEDTCDHTFSWKDNNDGTHTGTASCGKPEHNVTNEKHIWGEDNKCTKCEATKPVEADTRVFYVAGNFAGSDFSWPKEGTLPKMTQDAENGFLYTITIFMYKGEAFKIAGFDQEQTTAPEELWGLEINFDDYADEQKTFTQGEFGNIVAPKTGYFLIKLHTNDTYQGDGDSFSINIEDGEGDFTWDLYIYGTMNEWAQNAEYKMTAGENNTYTATVTITEDDLKKVDEQEKPIVPAFKVVNLHSGNAKYFGGEATLENPDGNFWLTKADTYTITFHTDTFAVEIKGENEDKPIPDKGDTRVFYVVGSVVDGYWHDEGTHLPLQLKKSADNGYAYTITLVLYKGETFTIIGFDKAPTTKPGDTAMYAIQAAWDDMEANVQEGQFVVGGQYGTDIVVGKEGVYTITLYTNDTYHNDDGDGFSIDAHRDDDIPWNLYIFGTMNEPAPGWAKDEDYKMENKGTSYTITFTTTKANEEFKVVNVTDKGDRYFDQGNDNIVLATAGEYTVTFDTATYEVTVKGKGQEDVKQDTRTYVLSGASTEATGTLYGNGFDYKSTDTKVAFSYTSGNTFVLKDVTLYEGDQLKIRFNKEWNSGANQYSYGAEVLYTATTVDSEGKDLGKIFVNDTSSAKFTNNGYIAKGMSGVYDIELTSKGAYTPTTAASQNQITLKFTQKQHLEDPDRSVIDFYLVGTVASKGMNNKWPGSGTTKDFVHLEKTVANTYAVTCTFASSDSFKVYCQTYGSWHTEGNGMNGNNMSVSAGTHTITVTVQAGATNFKDADTRVTVTIS